MYFGVAVAIVHVYLRVAGVGRDELQMQFIARHFSYRGELHLNDVNGGGGLVILDEPINQSINQSINDSMIQSSINKTQPSIK